jgi:hypothetical protein
MINGVFGAHEDKHIARWRPVKHTSVTTEFDEEGTELIRTKERFSNELALVFVCGTTMLLNESDKNAKDATAEPEAVKYECEDTPAVEPSSADEEGAPEKVAEEIDFSSPAYLVTLDIDSDATLADGSSMERRFEPGKLVMTSGVLDLVSRHGINTHQYLARHLNRDWGDLEPFDRNRNETAVDRGDQRILSSYDVPESPDGRIWIITEDDHSVTTILLPSEN